MQCAERRDLILLLAAGSLDPAEERELRAHLATGCPVCTGNLAEAHALLSHLPMALTPVQPSPAAKELLRIKVEGTNPQSANPIPISRGAPSAAPVRKHWTQAAGFSALAAAVAVAITYFTMNAIINQKENTINHLIADSGPRDEAIGKLSSLLKQREAQISDLSEHVRTAEAVIAMLRAPSVMVVDVAPVTPPAASPAQARMLWDSKTNNGMFIGSNIKPPAPGRCYELWLITGDKPEDKLAAGKVDISPTGETMLHIAWASPVRPLIFAITDEPARDSIKDPQGPVTMLGKIPPT